jgi:two-component system LytT family response regulator
MAAEHSPLRVVIVDDEAPARRGLRRLLETDGGVQIIQECAAGDEAVAVIDRHRPDVVFLDVQMPELDGFGVLRELKPPLPLVVFVTAFDAHAPAAFDAAAIDYLLKPLTAARARIAVERVRQRLRERSAVLGRQSPGHLTARIGSRIELIPISQIDWLEADGDYVRTHVGSQSWLMSETLGSLLERLDPRLFVRIHRARAVNIERVRALQRGEHGEYIIHLLQGASLTAGRSYTMALNERFSTRAT